MEKVREEKRNVLELLELFPYVLGKIVKLCRPSEYGSVCVASVG